MAAAAATAAPEVLPALAARISAVLAGPEVSPAVLAALRVLEAGSVLEFTPSVPVLSLYIERPAPFDLCRLGVAVRF